MIPKNPKNLGGISLAGCIQSISIKKTSASCEATRSKASRVLMATWCHGCSIFSICLTVAGRQRCHILLVPTQDPVWMGYLFIIIHYLHYLLSFAYMQHESTCQVPFLYRPVRYPFSPTLPTLLNTTGRWVGISPSHSCCEKVQTSSACTTIASWKLRGFLLCFLCFNPAEATITYFHVIFPYIQITVCVKFMRSGKNYEVQ